jgi:hypothetical protein
MMDWNQRLSEARTTNDFVSACGEIVAGSSDILSIDYEALKAFDEAVTFHRPGNWAFMLNDKAPKTAETVARQFAFNCLQNGGYFHMMDGAITQWASRGSGSQALAEFTDMLWQSDRMPGFNLKNHDHVVEALEKEVRSLPYAGWRMAACQEFADPCNETLFTSFIDALRSPSGEWTFDLRSADRLMGIYKAGFDHDPFRKRALLFLCLFAGWLSNSGETVNCDFPIPADYQIPRILEWKKAIRLTEGARERIANQTDLFEQGDNLVVALRAAAVVLMRRLGEQCGRQDWIADAALFTTYRKDADFLANALPPMKVRTTWF